MSYSYVEYVGNGTTRDFSVTFPFISRAHVGVTLNGTPMLNPMHYSWVSDSVIQFRTAPASGDVVTIARRTPIDTPLVDFQAGANLTEEQLDLAVSQQLYASQEIRDYYETKLNSELVRVGNGVGIVTTDPNQIIAGLVDAVLNDTLAAELQQRITDIDTNGQSILAVDDRVTTLQATVDALANIDGTGIVTFIENEQTQRIAGDEALAATIALMGAKSGDNLAFILDLNTTKVSPTESLAQRFSALSAEDSSNAAAIASEQTARVTADGALASDITALSTTVDGNTATITSLSQSLNGIAARYGVSLNVNGYITGFEQFNDGSSGTFSILADKFYIVDPANGGQNPKAVFGVVNGTVYAQNMIVKDAAIETLTVGKLTSGTVDAVMNFGNGRVVFDDGVYMKVTGVGFGTSNQFIEWFGPRPTGGNIALCSEANAIMYLKTNGAAYFGGTLSAGVFKNAAQSTSLAAPPLSVTVGPFTSNGGTIEVVASLLLKNVVPAYVPGSGGSATIKLYRKVGAGSESLVATQTLTGSVIPQNNEQRITGSITYTDPQLSTSNRTYRLELSSRTIDLNGTVTTQDLTLVCTEE